MIPKLGDYVGIKTSDGRIVRGMIIEMFFGPVTRNSTILIPYFRIRTSGNGNVVLEKYLVSFHHEWIVRLPKKI